MAMFFTQPNQARLRALLVLALLVLLAGACGQPSATPDDEAADRAAPGGDPVVAVASTMLDSGPLPQVGDTAPDFSYTLADGTTRRLSDLRGSKVLINFWATWCAPCRFEMPDIQEVANRHPGDEFVVLAVNADEPLEDVEAFGAELNLTIPLITNPSGDISDAYGAHGLPTSFFIDSDGVISHRQVGLISADFIETRLRAMQ